MIELTCWKCKGIGINCRECEADGFCYDPSSNWCRNCEAEENHLCDLCKGKGVIYRDVKATAYLLVIDLEDERLKNET